MGRQAYMTRLALGRSPFEPPEGPEAFEDLHGVVNDNIDGHRQEYNDRGHPINPRSRVEARELRRAKNDILSTVGVVVSKDDDKKLKYQKKSDKQKVSAVICETEYGLALAAFDLGLMFVTLWWIVSLRARFLTLKSYSYAPLVEILKSEVRHFGPYTFFCAGLPAWTVSHIINTWRNYLMNSTVEWIMQTFHPRSVDKRKRKRLQAQIGRYSELLGAGFYVLSYPIQAFALLQSLHLIPANTKPSVASLIPFTSSSPIALPSLPSSLSSTHLRNGIVGALTSPFLLGFAYDYLRHQIESKVYRNVRRRTLKPDNPDLLSVSAARADELDDTTIPGLGSMQRGNRGHQLRSITLWEELYYDLRGLKKWAYGLVGWKLPPWYVSSRRPDDAYYDRVRELDANYLQDERAVTSDVVPTERHYELFMMAIRQAHAERGIPSPENLDTFVHFTQDANQPTSGPMVDSASTEQVSNDEPTENQPTTVAVADQNSASEATMDPQSRARAASEDFLVQVPSRANTLFEPLETSPDPTPPTSPHVRASLIHQDSENITMQLEVLQSTRVSRPHQVPSVPPSAPVPQDEVQVTNDETSAVLFDEPFDDVPGPTIESGENQHEVTGSMADMRGIGASDAGSNASVSTSPDLPQEPARRAGDTALSTSMATLNPAMPQSDGLSASDHLSPVATPTSPVTVDQRVDNNEGTAETGASAPMSSTPVPQAATVPTGSSVATSAGNTDIAQGEGLPPLERTPDQPSHHITPIPPNRPNEEAMRRNHEIRQRLARRPPPQVHRVTALSNHPSDAMASHVSSLLATAILLPLEALYLRSLATSFLASARPGAIGLRADIRGVGAWFGGEGGIWGMGEYAGTMLLLLGLQGVVSSVVWSFGTGTAIWLGRRAFGWGKL